MLTTEARADQVFKYAGTPSYVKNLRPLRLLSLDGGGVRGVSELQILKDIMARESKIKGRKPGDDLHPYEYFDMIAGTSTGGLLAMMLGRLKMSIKECEAAYDKISKNVFGKKSAKLVKEKLKSSPDTTLYEDSHLAEDDKCKVLVITTRANKSQTERQVVHLRSYKTPPNLPLQYEGMTIWQAARATSAAPAYFDRLRLSERDGVYRWWDGGEQPGPGDAERRSVRLRLPASRRVHPLAGHRRPPPRPASPPASPPPPPWSSCPNYWRLNLSQAVSGTDHGRDGSSSRMGVFVRLDDEGAARV